MGFQRWPFLLKFKSFKLIKPLTCYTEIVRLFHLSMYTVVVILQWTNHQCYLHRLAVFVQPREISHTINLCHLKVCKHIGTAGIKGILRLKKNHLQIWQYTNIFFFTTTTRAKTNYACFSTSHFSGWYWGELEL